MDSILTGSLLLGMGSAYFGNALGTAAYNNRFLFKELDHQIGVNNENEKLIKQQTDLLVQQTNRIGELTNTKPQQQPRFKTAPDEKVTQPNFKKGGKKG